MAEVIRASQLTKDFGATRAVHELDLSVAAGEIYGLIGLNGAGKTTTIRMMTGVLAPTSGAIEILGSPVRANLGLVRARTAVVFSENTAAEPTWSAVRYLRYFSTLQGVEPKQQIERIKMVLSTLRLGDDVAERPIEELSGGNRRKVEIARALLRKPDLLLLDEPTRELDIPTKHATWRILRELNASGLTILLSSHDVEEISELCTRIGVMVRGRLVWEGEPRKLAGESSLGRALADLLDS